MIELLILYLLNNKILTMYGIFKEISTNFSVLTLPSYGTIGPALKRLGKNGFIKHQKEMSKGGRPSSFYSITKEGKIELRRLLLEEPTENPLHFLNISRIKLIFSDVLELDEKLQMLKTLKLKSEKLMYETKNLLESNELGFLSRIVYDNLLCEYKNFSLVLDNMSKSS